MVGITWTDKDIDLQFMENRLPEYWKKHHSGQARKRNPDKDAFIETTYQEYLVAFPGRVDTFEFPEIGTGGTPEERTKKVKKRFRDWFSNHLDKVTSNGTAKEEEKVLSLNEKKGSRRETTYHAYYRSEKKRLIPEIKADYEAHKAEMGEDAMLSIAHRNQFLAKRLKQESAEFQEEMANKRRAGANEDGSFDMSDFWVEGDEEKRVKAASGLQKSVNKLVRTIENAANSIHQKTGWSVVILVGGPEPMHDGNIRTMAMTKGCIASCGKRFEDFSSGWGAMFDSFTEFCEHVTPAADRKRFSLHSQSPSPSTSSAPKGTPEPENSMEESNTSVPTSASVSTSTSTSASTTAPSCATEPSIPSTSATSFGSQSARQMLEDTPGSIMAASDPKTYMPENPDDSAITAKEVPGGGAPENRIGSGGGPNGADVLSSQPDQPNSSPAAPESAPAPSPVIPSLVDSPPYKDSAPAPGINPIRVAETNATVPQPPVSKRTTRTPGKKAEDETKIWTYDAGVYLEKNLRQFGGEGLVIAFREYEKSLGNPIKKTKPFKLDLTSAPPALKQWHSGCKDFSQQPTKLTSKHLDLTIQWYLSLQPAVRGIAWPPARSVPEHACDWHPLFKGGPDGFFLFLMSLSWTPISDPDQAAQISELTDDVTWILRTLTNADNQYANITTSVANSKKRKLDGTGGRPDGTGGRPAKKTKHVA